MFTSGAAALENFSAIPDNSAACFLYDKDLVNVRSWIRRN